MLFLRDFSKIFSKIRGFSMREIDCVSEPWNASLALIQGKWVYLSENRLFQSHWSVFSSTIRAIDFSHRKPHIGLFWWKLKNLKIFEKKEKFWVLCRTLHIFFVSATCNYHDHIISQWLMVNYHEFMVEYHQLLMLPFTMSWW